MRKYQICFFLLAYCLGISAAYSAAQVMGYFPAWSRVPVSEMVRDGTMVAEDVTVIHYAFLAICWDGVHGNPDVAGDDSDADALVRPCQDGNGVANHAPNGSIVLSNPALDSVFGGSGLNHLGQLLGLKERNPHLKLVASVGGWTGSDRFSIMARNAVTRNNFVSSAIVFLRAYHFDGIDIDWEFPGAIGLPCSPSRLCQSESDKHNYLLLIQSLRAALDQAGDEDGKHYVISIAAGAMPSFLENSKSELSRVPGQNKSTLPRLNLQSPAVHQQPVEENWLRTLSASLDWVTLMNYDYHGPWDPSSGLIAPMGFDVRDPNASANAGFGTAMIEQFLKHVPAHKLLLGMALYGYGWSECAAGIWGDGLYQPCLGGGLDPSVLDFSRIDVGIDSLRHTEMRVADVFPSSFAPCDQLAQSMQLRQLIVGQEDGAVTLAGLVDWSLIRMDEFGKYTVGRCGFRRYWNRAAQLPYLYNPTSKLFITYEDELSIHNKNQAILFYGLGGAMLWQLALDRHHILGGVVSHDLLGK